MTTIVTRLYAAEGKAVGAVEALKSKFAETEIAVLTSKNAQKGDIEALVARTGVPKDAAAIFADGIRKGGALVTARVPWGFASKVIKHLDSHGPIEVNVPVTEYSINPGWHESAPFSEWLGWPVLEKFRSTVALEKNPAPLSGALRIETLLKSKSRTKLFNNPAIFSSLLGLPTLDKTEPFSVLVKNDKSHVKLVKGAAPFSTAFFVPTVWKK
jgi:hypothetical protein